MDRQAVGTDGHRQIDRQTERQGDRRTGRRTGAEGVDRQGEKEREREREEKERYGGYTFDKLSFSNANYIEFGIK